MKDFAKELRSLDYARSRDCDALASVIADLPEAQQEAIVDAVVQLASRAFDALEEEVHLMYAEYEEMV